MTVLGPLQFISIRYYNGLIILLLASNLHTLTLGMKRLCLFFFFLFLVCAAAADPNSVYAGGCGTGGAGILCEVPHGATRLDAYDVLNRAPWVGTPYQNDVDSMILASHLFKGGLSEGADILMSFLPGSRGLLLRNRAEEAKRNWYRYSVGGSTVGADLVVAQLEREASVADAMDFASIVLGLVGEAAGPAIVAGSRGAARGMGGLKGVFSVGDDLAEMAMIGFQEGAAELSRVSATGPSRAPFGRILGGGGSFIDERALLAAKREAQLMTGGETVTYWRVDNPKRSMFIPEEGGNLSFRVSNANRNKQLYLSRGGAEHVQHFAGRASGERSVVSFEVPAWFDDLVRETAIPQTGARSHPRFDRRLGVQEVDRLSGAPGNPLQLGPGWRPLFEEAMVPGSAVVH